MSLTRLFRSVVESTPNAIIITDEQGCIFRVNLKTEEYFRDSREELIGEPKFPALSRSHCVPGS